MNFKRALLIVLMAAFILPNIVLAQEGVITARFEVNKVFTDGFDGEVEVTIVCNTGLPLEQSAMVSPGNQVTFVVEELFIDVEGVPTVCTITEDGETGYTALYDATGADESFISCEFDSGGVFENLNPLNECDIVNTPTPVTVAVAKVWAFAGAGGDDVDTDVRIRARSEGFITSGFQCYTDDWCIDLYFDGSETESLSVVPAWDGVVVSLTEYIGDSAVESDNTCGGGTSGSVTVKPNQGASCTFTNTVFFEGIPTLSQYGLAIMALLMLGVGFVGFRRFV